METKEWLKVARRHVDGPADFAVLIAWMMRNHGKDKVRDALAAVKGRADALEVELVSCPPISLPDVSEELRMLLISRLCEGLGMSVAHEDGELVIRGWVK